MNRKTLRKTLWRARALAILAVNLLFAQQVQAQSNTFFSAPDPGNNVVDQNSAGTATFIQNAGTYNFTLSSSAHLSNSAQLISVPIIGTFSNLGSLSTDSSFVVGAVESIGTLTNSGTISSNFGQAVFSFDGGIGTLTNSGTISTTNTAVAANNGNIGTLTNTGLITGTQAVFIVNGNIGTLTNTGTISGINTSPAVFSFEGNIGTLTNTGLITGDQGVVVNNGNIGTLTNTGTISGTNGGVTAAGSIGTLTNTGTISGLGFNGITSTDYANITLNPGSVTSGASAIFVNSATLSINPAIAPYQAQFPNLFSGGSVVTINGLAQIQGGIVENQGLGLLRLNLAGFNTTDQAIIKATVAADAGQTNGHVQLSESQASEDKYDYTFIGFDLTDFGGANLYRSQVSSPLQSLAGLVDDQQGNLPNTPGFNNFLTLANTNPELAFQILSGRSQFIGTDQLAVNLFNQLNSGLGQQLDGVLGDNVGGFNTAGLSIGDGELLAFNNTAQQLEGLTQQAVMSDVGAFDGLGLTPTASSVNDSKKWGAWATGTVSIAHQAAVGNQPKYNSLNGTPTLGASYRVNHEITVGAFTSYATGSARFGDGSKISSDNEFLGGFATYEKNNWQGHAHIAGGLSQYNNKRETFDGTATSSPDGYNALGDITGGYQFHLPAGYFITPQIGLQYAHIYQDGYSESGSSVGLNVGHQEIDSLRTHAGFIASRAFQIDKQFQVSPELHAAWYHECLDDSRNVDAALNGLGSFTVDTIAPERDYALVGAGLSTAFTGYGLPIGTFVRYDVQAGQSSYIQHNINAGVKVSF